MADNYYDILGVSKTASADEIKKAYRKLAHQYHPDKGQGNEEKFKQANEAYQVLSNAEKRAQYDQYGQTFEQAQRSGGGGFGGGFGDQGNPFGGFDFNGAYGQSAGGGIEFDLGDLFGDIFGGRSERQARRTRGVDLEMPLTIKFEEAVFGAAKAINLEKKDKCPTCSGKGAEPGSKIITCPVCHGQGHIRTQRRTIFGNVASTTTCEHCEGFGKIPENPCHTCKGSGVTRQEKTLQIKIPAGIADGQRIRLAGEGEVGYRDSQAGDLYVVIRVQPSKEFVRDGNNLLKDLPISFTQAALGTNIPVQTLDGDIEIKIPSGTQSGKILRIASKGVPFINSGKRGDLLLTVRVIVPQKLSKKEAELLKDLAKIRGETVDIPQSLWDSLKDNF
jgi:molecular chaperone DnaJ